MLRYSSVTLKSWDINTQKAIIRDMGMGILDRLSSVTLIWNLFDDSRSQSKAILGKLSTVIDKYNEEKGLPSFSGMSKAEVDLVEELWGAVKGAFEAMVVTKIERKGIVEIQRSHRLGGESDLGYLTCMHLLFQLVGRWEEKSEVVLIVFGRLVVK